MVPRRVVFRNCDISWVFSLIFLCAMINKAINKVDFIQYILNMIVLQFVIEYEIYET